MAAIGTILGLYRYPVKSMGGERVEEADLLAGGMAEDRLYAFESAEAPPGMLRVSGAQRRELLAHRAWLDQHGKVKVQIPEGTVLPVDKAFLLDGRFKLTHAVDPQTDVRPLSLLSAQTVEELTREFGATIAPERFRANLVLDLAGPGFCEDKLVGQTVRLGAEATVLIRERTPRCRFVTYDPAAPLTAEPAFALMKLLDQRHRGRVGVYASVLRAGRMRVGDAVEICDEQK